MPKKKKLKKQLEEAKAKEKVVRLETERLIKAVWDLTAREKLARETAGDCLDRELGIGRWRNEGGKQ